MSKSRYIFLACAIGIFIFAIAVRIEGADCDGSGLDTMDNGLCSRVYSASVFCVNKDTCTGMGAKTAGPSVSFGCLAPNPSDPNSLCVMDDRDCTKQWGCVVSQGGGCEVGLELATFYQTEYAALESCTPVDVEYTEAEL